MEPRWERVRARYGGRGPGRRWGHTCNAVDGGRLVYVFGGYGENNRQTNDVHVFDTVNHTWSKPLITGIPPSPRDSHTTTTVGNKLFVFGGTDGSHPLKDLHILDTSYNMWISPTVHGKGPDAREGHASSVVGSRLFIFGGCGKSYDNPVHIFYDDLYSLDTDNLVWNRIATSGAAPCARESHTCSSWKNKLIILGGEDASDYYLSDAYMLDTGTFVWSKINSFGQMLAPRAGHCTLALGKKLFVYGGFADDRNLYSDLHAFNVDSGAWTRAKPTEGGPSPRFSAAGDCIDAQNGIFLLFGGCSSSLEALGDMYFLHAGSAVDMTFQAMITSASPHGYTLETRIDGMLFRGIVFSTQSSNPRGLYMPLTRTEALVDVRGRVKTGVRSSTTLSGLQMESTDIIVADTLQVKMKSEHRLTGACEESTDIIIADTLQVKMKAEHSLTEACRVSFPSLRPEMETASSSLLPIIIYTPQEKQLSHSLETSCDEQMTACKD